MSPPGRYLAPAGGHTRPRLHAIPGGLSAAAADTQLDRQYEDRLRLCGMEPPTEDELLHYELLEEDRMDDYGGSAA